MFFMEVIFGLLGTAGVQETDPAALGRQTEGQQGPSRNGMLRRTRGCQPEAGGRRTPMLDGCEAGEPTKSLTCRGSEDGAETERSFCTRPS